MEKKLTGQQFLLTQLAQTHAFIAQLLDENAALLAELAELKQQPKPNGHDKVPDGIPHVAM